MYGVLVQLEDGVKVILFPSKKAAEQGRTLLKTAEHWLPINILAQSNRNPIPWKGRGTKTPAGESITLVHPKAVTNNFL